MRPGQSRRPQEERDDVEAEGVLQRKSQADVADEGEPMLRGRNVRSNRRGKNAKPERS